MTFLRQRIKTSLREIIIKHIKMIIYGAFYDVQKNIIKKYIYFTHFIKIFQLEIMGTSEMFIYCQENYNIRNKIVIQ